MKHTRKKNNGGKRHMLPLPLFLVAVIALIVVATAPDSWAHGRNQGVEELEKAEAFIEWNSTDGDFGIQFFWDSMGFTRMTVRNTHGKKVLDIKTSKNVRAQGLTEGFFESVEPDPEELSLEEFLDRFPEGEYRFIGRSIEGGWLVGETEFTHNIPCPPLAGSIGDPGTLVVGWRPVINQLDTDTGECGDEEVDIVAYEVVFEMEALVGEGEEEEEKVFVDTATLPADASSFTASPEFVSAAAAFRAEGKLLVLKFEVIAIEASANRTIVEQSLFELEEEE
jgi:hypothetical protein